MHYLLLILGGSLFSVGIVLGVCGVRWHERRHKPGTVAVCPGTEEEVTTVVASPAPPDEADEAVADVVRQQSLELTDEDREFARRLLELIDQRIDQRNLQVDMLASEMAMSHTLFYDRVHRALGESPATLLRNRRLARAKVMLAEQNRTVAEVALLCGFSDAKYFSTVFKKKYGVSPSKI